MCATTSGLRIGKVRFGGITRDVCLECTSRTPAVGEFVLVHVGFAIAKIDREEAARTYQVLEELGQTGELTADREPMEPAMKYLDEYRDGDVADGLRRAHRRHRHPPLGADGGVRRPDALDRPLRHRSHAPADDRAGARPGLPGVRHPARDDRSRARDRAPAGRHLHLLRRHAARARLARRSPRRCRAAAPTCASSTRRSTRVRIARDNPQRRVVFFGIGFETTAPANAMAVFQAPSGRASATSRCSSRTCSCRRRCAAILQAPGNRVQGVPRPRPRVRRHGLRRVRGARARYRVPIVVTGFEPVDLLEGILMAVAPARGGPRRGGEPVRARRDARAATRRRATLVDRGLRGRRPQVARRRRHPRSGLPAARRVPRCTTPSGSSRSRTSPPREPEVCISGLVLRGQRKPSDCPAFGRQCTPEHAARRHHGLGRGRLRRVLPVRTPSRRSRTGGRRCRVTAPTARSRSATARCRSRRARRSCSGTAAGGKLSAAADRAASSSRRSGTRSSTRSTIRRSSTVDGVPARLHHRLLRGHARSSFPAATSASWR